jgi:hypothetical protein
MKKTVGQLKPCPILLEVNYEEHWSPGVLLLFFFSVFSSLK